LFIGFAFSFSSQLLGSWTPPAHRFIVWTLVSPFASFTLYFFFSFRIHNTGPHSLRIAYVHRFLRAHCRRFSLRCLRLAQVAVRGFYLFLAAHQTPLPFLFWTRATPRLLRTGLRLQVLHCVTLYCAFTVWCHFRSFLPLPAIHRLLPEPVDDHARAYHPDLRCHLSFTPDIHHNFWFRLYTTPFRTHHHTHAFRSGSDTFTTFTQHTTFVSVPHGWSSDIRCPSKTLPSTPHLVSPSGFCPDLPHGSRFGFTYLRTCVRFATACVVHAGSLRFPVRSHTHVLRGSRRSTLRTNSAFGYATTTFSSRHTHRTHAPRSGSSAPTFSRLDAIPRTAHWV